MRRGELSCQELVTTAKELVPRLVSVRWGPKTLGASGPGVLGLEWDGWMDELRLLLFWWCGLGLAAWGFRPPSLSLSRGSVFFFANRPGITSGALTRVCIPPDPEPEPLPRPRPPYTAHRRPGLSQTPASPFRVSGPPRCTGGGPHFPFAIWIPRPVPPMV